MHIGLFGGTFDPPHLAHLIVAETIGEEFGLDGVRWIPSYLPPHKTGAVRTPAHHRLAMTRLAVAGNDRFDVSDAELQRKGTSYTLDTVRAMQEAEPGTSFSLIVGGDSLADFMTWHAPEAIVERVPLIVYRRPGAQGPTEAGERFAERIRYAEAPLIDIASADLRRRKRAGRSIRYLVPEAVLAYIDAHGLYRPGTPRRAP